MQLRHFIMFFIALLTFTSCGGSDDAGGTSGTPQQPQNNDSANLVVITEIMYHPKDATGGDVNQYEFLELQNRSTSEANVSGCSLNGIDYIFADGSTIAAGAFFVIARDGESFSSRYGFNPDGLYAPDPGYDPAVDDPADAYRHLANEGEKISLKTSSGKTIVSVEYSNKGKWQRGAAGFGYSLVIIDAGGDFDDPYNWRASTQVNGSPGEEDPLPGYGLGLVINEALAHTDGDDLDSIELYNTSGDAIDIGGWFLADQSGKPDVANPAGMKMYKIPANTTIAANGYFIRNESDFKTNNLRLPFGLSEYGDTVFLYSADSSESFTGFMLGEAFGATGVGQSLGRYVTSTGVDFPILETETIGAANSDPLVGPVVVNEIMYNPSAGNTVEFVELYNLETWPVDLSGWKLEGIGYEFPEGTEIAANGFLLIIDGGGPESPIGTTGDTGQEVDYTDEINDFRASNGVDAAIPILADAIVLENEGETLILKMPNGEELAENMKDITVDKVSYNDKTPWPEAADGTGVSLERINPAKYGNDPVNWRASSEDGGNPGK